MSIEQLDLLLCDTYQMDAWFPFGWKWNKELEKSSYSVWAIDELKRYIVGRLYPKHLPGETKMKRRSPNKALSLFLLEETNGIAD